MKNIHNIIIVIIYLCIFIPCYSLENEDDTIEIPFTIEYRRIIINGNINGIMGRFVWDTGSPYSEVNCPLDNLELYAHNSSYAPGGGVTGFSESDLYLINEIALEGVKIKTTSLIQNISEFTQNVILEPAYADGLLGSKIFSGYWCELSFSKKKIILHKEKPSNFIKNIQAIYENGCPSIVTDINNTDFKLIIDTGCPYPLLINDYTIGDDSIKILSSNPMYIYGCYFMVARNFILFDDVFDKAFFPLNPSFSRYGLIGIEFLENYDMLFDFTESNLDNKSIYYESIGNHEKLYKYLIPSVWQESRIDGYWIVSDGIKLNIREDSHLLSFGIDSETIISKINNIWSKNIDTYTLFGDDFFANIKEITIIDNGVERIIPIEIQSEINK